jgi:hypothetical protein
MTTFQEYLTTRAYPLSYYDKQAHLRLTRDTTFMQMTFIQWSTVESYVVNAYPGWEIKAGAEGLYVNYQRWLRYKPKTWRTCPKCRSKATKLVSLTGPKMGPTTGSIQCQSCNHEYDVT